MVLVHFRSRSYKSCLAPQLVPELIETGQEFFLSRKERRKVMMSEKKLQVSEKRCNKSAATRILLLTNYVNFENFCTS